MDNMEVAKMLLVIASHSSEWTKNIIAETYEKQTLLHFKIKNDGLDQFTWNFRPVKIGRHDSRKMPRSRTPRQSFQAKSNSVTTCILPLANYSQN